MRDIALLLPFIIFLVALGYVFVTTNYAPFVPEYRNFTPNLTSNFTYPNYTVDLLTNEEIMVRMLCYNAVRYNITMRMFNYTCFPVNYSWSEYNCICIIT